MIGDTISRYKILDKISGSPDQGPIFKALDVELGHMVTLKFLPPSLGDKEESKGHFIDEATRASGLGHPNIATIYEIGETRGEQIFIASSFHEGQTLEEMLRDGIPQSVETVVSWGRQLASALRAAHDAGIVHRDVKPSNVFVTSAGRIRLLDFGLAKVMGDGGMTLTGLTQGTPAYMAPEQIKGGEIDARTDLWAVGVLLYQGLAGERPFTGANVPAVVHAVYSLDPRPLSEYRNDIPPDLVRIVHHLLKKNPDDRPATARELLTALGASEDEEFGSEMKTPSSPIRVPKFDVPSADADILPTMDSATAPGKRILAVGVILIVLMVLIGLYFVYHSIPPGR